MPDNPVPRVLTYDERKAAAAAFAGRPFDPAWSEAARIVYDGILAARGLPEPVPPPVTPEQPARPETGAGEREKAVEAGALIDVTSIAHKLGIRLPVSFTRPLWELGITAMHNVPEAEHEGRVRDVLMAFRLRLAASRVASPLVEFPALLSFPPDPVPQSCVLFAVAHQNADTPMALTFLLPGEVSTDILPFKPE